MDLLTAVNRILPVLGEHPVTSINARHPTLAVLLPKIDTKLEDETMRGWWFNSFKTTLPVDSGGEVAVPADTLSFIPDTAPAVVRGQRLYNTATMSYMFPEAVSGEIVTRVPFELLPESVASLVWYSALVDAYVTDIGMESSVRVWMQQADTARARMEAEHLQHRKYMTIKNPRFRRIQAALRG